MTNEELAILCKTDSGYLPELWARVRRLIGQWAMKYLPTDGNTSHYEMDDLIQSAYFALLGAVEAYPENSRYKFATFLGYHCRNAFADTLGLRSRKYKPFVLSLDAPLSSEDDFTLLDTLEDESAPEGFEEAERRIDNEQLAVALEQALSTIPDREREVICKRYYEDKPFKEIGAELGCSDGAARQAEYNGLRGLRCGKAYRILKGFDYRGEGLRGTGLSRFRETRTSSTEAAVLRLMERDYYHA